METIETVNIEEMASKLNRVVILDKETWQLIVYSTLSPYSPRIQINGIPVRPNLHTLLVGDVATAKSRICKIVEAISPRSSRVTKVTEAGLEGIGRKGYIETGLIDMCNDGLLIVPEFTKIYQKYKILREMMDCETVTIIKGGETKKVNVNTTFFVGSNPTEDFFRRGGRLRNQIPFREGVFTRFDIVIPLVNTCERNKLLLGKINIFGLCEAEVSLMRIRSILNTIAERMSQVEEVTLSVDQKNMVKEVFLKHNRELPNRPLLLMRDLEILSRLINVITASKFQKDSFSPIVPATDEDVEEGIEFWEKIVDLRKTLYIGTKREILSVKEKILQEIIKLGRVRTIELERLIVDIKNLCSRSTFYRKVKNLRMEGKIEQDGLRNGEVYPT